MVPNRLHFYVPEAFLTKLDRLAHKAARFSKDFQHSHQLDSLNAAIRAFREMLALLPMNSPEYPPALSNLGSSLIDRYIHTGQLSNLEEGVQLCRRAVELIPNGSPIPPDFQNHLGIGLGCLYEAIGQHAFLDEAIERFRDAVSHPYSDASALPDYLNNLGFALRKRYHREGRLADLNEAVTVHKMAVQKTSNSLRLAGYLNNLSFALRTRYNHTAQLDDLNQAIQHCEEGLAYSADDSVTQAYLFTTLAVSLRDRAVRTGNLLDLDASIELCMTALAKMSPNASNRAILLDNLGNGLRVRFGYTKTLSDLDDAITAHEEAVAQTQEGSPYLPGYLSTLGNALSNRYDETGQAEDLENAKQVYARACELGLNIAPDRVVRCACNWARWALSRQAWSEVMTAFTYGSDATDKLRGVQLDRPGQEGILALSRGLASVTTYALAKMGNLPRAVEVIEQGRARQLAEALEQNRSDLEQLPTLGYGDLYEQYQELCNQLTLRLPSDSIEGMFDNRLIRMEHLETLERVSAKLEAVILAIQQIAGYEDFQAKPSYERIQAAFNATDNTAATIGVYLLTTEVGGLALIVHAGITTPVWLDKFTDAVLNSLLQSWFTAYDEWQRAATPFERAAKEAAWLQTVDEVTKRLWELVMGPLAQTVHQLDLPSNLLGQPPAVTLIPIDLLALLPLHAAWTETPSTSSKTGSSNRHYFIDDYAVNYAPSATALRHCRSHADDAANPTALLAIAEPQPIFGASPLPNAAHEVVAIASLFAQSTILTHTQAQCSTVRAALSTAAVVHFACHGTNSWQDPLASNLWMANNEKLTVRNFLETHLPPSRLAVLSACETGLVGTRLPDEAVTLPSALIQAGYAGVVASLWSIADLSTAMLMVRFYECWRVEGLAPIYALRSAQRWLRDTTNREKQAYFRYNLSPQTTLGIPAEIAREFFYQLDKRAGDERTFDHPFWWAAFYLTGV
jgi:CHAT domain-containing protein/tetratricopeptide (TPR) repeat protein